MKTFFKVLMWGLFGVVFFSLCTGAYFWYVWSSNLPYIGSVKEYRPPIITEIFSDDGKVIGRLWEEKRTVISLDQMPKHLIQAFVAAEDSRFFEHEGVDIKGIFRAFIKNLTSGRITQGGSTITQQVTKSLLLKNVERTYRRKAREAILSLQLEKELSKAHILYLYLNQIYLGHGAYGVEAAARTYFNKPAKDLTLAESALLAGLPQAPARYSPVDHFERAKARQIYVLERMLEEGMISREAFDTARNIPFDIHSGGENVFERAPYFTEHVRQYLLKKYGKDSLYRGGLKVYTTLDLNMQTQAREALNKGLAELDKREGYRGPLRHLSAREATDFRTKAIAQFLSAPPETGAVVEGLVAKVDDEKEAVTVYIGEETARLLLKEMTWARKPDKEIPYYEARVRKPSQVLSPGDLVLVRLSKKVGETTAGPRTEKGEPETDGPEGFSWEVSLEQVPFVQGAVVCIETETGKVKTLLGGRDFSTSQFNRAIQARRQPGSAFKPLIYAAALDKGMTPATIIMDAPYVSERNLEGEAWKPKNYKEKFYGPTLIRTGLAKSRNVITVKILKKIGIDYAIGYARNMGIESELAPDLSLALGSSGVSLLEITRAYTVFANAGMLVTPIFVKRVVDRNGLILEENQPETRPVISKATSFVMTDLLRAVITEGTGWRIRALKRPASGKTGTTNDLRDAWFLGYTPDLVAGVWVGYDDSREMGDGETGSRAASPIWLDFMSGALEGKAVKDFEVPDGVVFAKIDTETGLLAGRYSRNTVFQSFIEGTQPETYSPKPAAASLGAFSQFDMDLETRN
jgi:penicillin-binding protein 1A